MIIDISAFKAFGRSWSGAAGSATPGYMYFHILVLRFLTPDIQKRKCISKATRCRRLELMISSSPGAANNTVKSRRGYLLVSQAVYCVHASAALLCEGFFKAGDADTEPREIRLLRIRWRGGVIGAFPQMDLATGLLPWM
jgi:hypothetical protein